MWYLLSIIVGIFCGVYGMSRIYRTKYKVLKEQLSTNDEKWKEFYQILNLWLELSQSGHSVTEYFEKRNINTIAVYGMKELGERLIYEIKDSKTDVSYLIDKNADTVYSNMKVYYPYEELPKVDAIVVTAIHYYPEIEEELYKRVNYPIINLTDIIYESLNDNIDTRL